MSKSSNKQIYDDIVFDYAAIKSNPFKALHEENSYWNVIGDVGGMNVLDLACGSGYYTRKFREKGAAMVMGVDISENMITEAKNIEAGNPLGLTYCVGNAEGFEHDTKFDIVTAQYLLSYADSESGLLKMCEAFYKNSKTGGRSVTMTSVLDPSCNYEDRNLGYSFVSSTDHQVLAAESFEDGAKAETVLYSNDRKSKCSFPNFLWKPSTICDLMRSCGFDAVEYSFVLPGCPVVVITAIK